MNRSEHLAWAKTRALQYVDAGDPITGLTSMFSDLNKHDELRGHPAIFIGMQLMMTGMTPERARDFIAGFN